MANHTSPIDGIILASDGYYAMVRPLSVVFLGQDFLLIRAGRLLDPSPSSRLRVSTGKHVFMHGPQPTLSPWFPLLLETPCDFDRRYSE